LSPLNRRWPLLNGANAIQVELGAPVEGVDAVLLLVHVGQLGVAVAKHQRVAQQRVEQALEARVELVERRDALAVAPRVLALFGGWAPPDAAELAYEVGLAAVGDRLVAIVC